MSLASPWSCSFKAHGENFREQTKRDCPALERNSRRKRVFQTRIRKGKEGARKGFLD